MLLRGAELAGREADRRRLNTDNRACQMPGPDVRGGVDKGISVAEASAVARGLRPGAVAWSVFEGARNPYVVLVTIYVFMPYFSSVVVGDPVRGQQAVASYGQWSGIIVAMTAPLLGASVDRFGPRKPMLLVAVGLMVPLIASLWWTTPDGHGLSVSAVVIIAAAINVLFSYSEVLHNSMLVRAAGLRNTHAASGLALALGNGVSVTVLVVVLWAFVLPAAAPNALLHAPLFGLNAARHEPSRIVAPIAAAVLALGSAPLFLLTPDTPRSSVRIGQAIGEGGRNLMRMLRSLRGRRDAALFLLARMLYIDAMTGVLLFSGVYASGVMKWGTAQLLVYGVLLSVLAVIGGGAASVMDHRLGPKAAVRIEIGVTVTALVALVGMAPDRILYVWRIDPAHAAWAGPLFHTASELIYLAIAGVASIFITASYASSRTLLTRLTPPGESGAFFGLYALSGTATLWLGSALVLAATAATHTQQAGFIALAILMLLGFTVLLFVRGGGRLQGAETWRGDLDATLPSPGVPRPAQGGS